MNILVPLSKTLLQFLKKKDYTHMQLRGISVNPATADNPAGDDDYILVPWKKGIETFADSSLRVEKIDSGDVTDMLDVEFGIDFQVEMSGSLANRYKESIRKG